MAGPPQMPFRPQQAMQGQFPPVSGPSPSQGPYGYPQTTVYPMGQPSPPVYIVRAPSNPMTGMPPYQAQNFEPRTRERKIIQIKDPNSNKDVTQEILNRQPSGSLTSSTTGTPNNSTPDISGQSSSSSTPPLTPQQQTEANVRAQFAAQVAATLANDSEEKPKKVVEYTIQKAPGNNKPVPVDTSKVKEVTDITKGKVAKETEISSTINISETKLAEKPVENVVESQSKEEVAKGQPKEAVQGSKLNDTVSIENSLGPKSLVCSVDATSTKGIITNVRVEIVTPDDVRNKEQAIKEAQQSSTAAGDVKTIVEPAKEPAKEPSEGPAKEPANEPAKEPAEEAAEPAATELVPVEEAKTLNGPVTLSSEEVQEIEEEVKNVEAQKEVEAQPVVEAQSEVEAPPVEKVTEPVADSKVDEVVQRQVAEPESKAEESVEAEVLPTAPELADAADVEKLNGNEGDVKVPAVPKNPVDTQAAGLYLFLMFLISAISFCFSHNICTYSWLLLNLIESSLEVCGKLLKLYSEILNMTSQKCVLPDARCIVI